jgi:hypothetical protein
MNLHFPLHFHRVSPADITPAPVFPTLSATRFLIERLTRQK